VVLGIVIKAVRFICDLIARIGTLKLLFCNLISRLGMEEFMFKWGGTLRSRQWEAWDWQ